MPPCSRPRASTGTTFPVNCLCIRGMFTPYPLTQFFTYENYSEIILFRKNYESHAQFLKNVFLSWTFESTKSLKNYEK